MTTEQECKLREAIEIIQSTFKTVDPKIIAIGLSIAGVYCNEVAEDLDNVKSGMVW